MYATLVIAANNYCGDRLIAFMVHHLGRGGGGGRGDRGMPLNLAVNQMTELLGRLQLTAAPSKYDPQIGYTRAKRPGLGTAGQESQVLANHFSMTLKATQAFHYDVTMAALDGDKEPKGKKGGELQCRSSSKSVVG